MKELIDQGYKACNSGMSWCYAFVGIMFGFMCSDSFMQRYVPVVIDFIFLIIFWRFARHFKKRREYWEFRKIEENFTVKED